MADVQSIKLIVGLGNPGSNYAGTRHNMGFDFLDAVAQKYKITFREENKFKGLTARLATEENDLWLLKPQTFMNLSGEAVQAFASYYKISPEEILVVHDELDIVPGTMKFKLGGGNAGHNGLKSITENLATPNFYRLRIGIGHPRTFNPSMQVYDWVLGRPEAGHREGINRCINGALGIIENLAAGKIQSVERTIGKFSKLPPPPKKETQENETKE